MEYWKWKSYGGGKNNWKPKVTIHQSAKGDDDKVEGHCHVQGAKETAKQKYWVEGWKESDQDRSLAWLQIWSPMCLQLKQCLRLNSSRKEDDKGLSEWRTQKWLGNPSSGWWKPCVDLMSKIKAQICAKCPSRGLLALETAASVQSENGEMKSCDKWGRDWPQRVDRLL